MRENHFGAPRAFSDVFPLIPCLTSLFLVSRPLSTVSCICVSLPTVRCPQSYVSVPCLPSSVHCLTYLSLAYRPLAPVLRLCSLYNVYHVHFQSFSSFPLSPILCPLLPSLSNVHCILSHVFVLYFVSRPFFPVSRLCPLFPSCVPCLT